MRVTRVGGTFAAVALALIVAGCGAGGVEPRANPSGSGSSPGSTSTPGSTDTATPGGSSTSTPAPSSARVSIIDNAYQPAEITVAVGGQVTWTHNGAALHSVTADDQSFDSSPLCPTPPSGCMTQSATFSFTFARAGRFSYHCRVHTNLMTGTVIVR